MTDRGTFAHGRSLVTGRYGFGRCTSCGEKKMLVQDGSVRAHDRLGYSCPGSRLAPAEDLITEDLLAAVAAAQRKARDEDCALCPREDCPACAVKQARAAAEVIEARIAAVVVRRALGSLRAALRAEADRAPASGNQHLTYAGGLRRAVRLTSAAYDAADQP